MITLHGIRAATVVSVLSILSASTIVGGYLLVHDKTISTLDQRLEEIERHITTKTVDRYHGSDARRDFAKVHKDMKQIKLDIRKLKVRELPKPSPVTCPNQTHLDTDLTDLLPKWISC